MTLGGRDRYDPDRMDSLGESAVVAGGSLAGLCAAGVLADGFEEVVVLERDEFPDGAVAREGAPRPAIRTSCSKPGERHWRTCSGIQREAGVGRRADRRRRDRHDLLRPGRPLADGPERLPMYCASRPLIESVVRQQVAAIPNVILRGGHRFTGFETDADTNTVTGVSITAGDDESVRDAAPRDRRDRADEPDTGVAGRQRLPHSTGRRGPRRRDLQHRPRRTAARRPARAGRATVTAAHPRRRRGAR